MLCALSSTRLLPKRNGERPRDSMAIKRIDPANTGATGFSKGASVEFGRGSRHAFLATEVCGYLQRE